MSGTRGAAHEPLVIAEQGHFFSGVRRRTGAFGTAVTGMHVEYQIPAHQRHPYPLVMVHGGGGQGLDFLATPDGRPGWATLFLAAGIHGNGHLMMLERNNAEIADLIGRWIIAHAPA